MKEGKDEAPPLLLGDEGGGTLLLLRTPPSLLVGLDMAQWRVGKKFRGVRCIDRGCHFLHWTENDEIQTSSESSQDAQCTYTRMRVDEAIGSTGQRGEFIYFEEKQIVIREWSASLGRFLPLSEDETLRYAAGVERHDFIHGLGIYPRHMRAQWQALTSNISKQCVQRVEPIGRCLEAEGMPLTVREQELIRNSNSNGSNSSSSSSSRGGEEGLKKIGRHSQRVSFKRVDVEGEEEGEEEEPAPADEEDEAAREKKDKAEAAACKMFYLEVKPARAAAVSAAREAAAKARRSGSDAAAAAAAAAAAVTLQCTDRSDALMQLAAEHEEGWNAILGELEVAFIALVLGHHYPSFVHWKNLVELLASSEKAIYLYPDIFAKFLNAFYAQLEQAPDEMTQGALQEGDFLSSSCAALVETCYRIDREAAYRELLQNADRRRNTNKAMKQKDRTTAHQEQAATAAGDAAPAAAGSALSIPSMETQADIDAEASAKQRLQEMEEKYRLVEEAASRLFDLVKVLFIKATGGNDEDGISVSPLDEVLLALQGPDAPVIVDAEELEAVMTNADTNADSSLNDENCMQTE
ncbi:hypothetical protein ACSSS7_006507 [Eimeria intestinalis]